MSTDGDGCVACTARLVIRVRCGQPPVHSRPAAGLPRGLAWEVLPLYAPQPDAPSRVLPGSSLKQHCPPEPCAQVRGPSMCSQNAEARFADACGSNCSKTAVWSRSVLGSPWPGRAGTA